MREKQKGDRGETAREKSKVKVMVQTRTKRKKKREQTNEQTIAMCFI